MIIVTIFLLIIGQQKLYSIPTVVMQPTLRIGDVFVAENYRLYGGIGPMAFEPAPERGDLVVFRNGTFAPGELWVMRVMGIPGDRVAMKKGRVVLNGEVLPRRELDVYEEPDSMGTVETVILYEETMPDGLRYHIQEIGDHRSLDNISELEVPIGMYLVIGDNRDRAADSRWDKVGLVPFDALVGRVPVRSGITFISRNN